MSTFEVSISEELKEIRKDIRELRSEVTKYKGFIGGLMWTVAALFAGFNFIIEWIKG